MLVPLYGFLQGDSMGLLVLVRDEDRVQDVGDALQQAAAVRIAPRARVRVMWDPLESTCRHASLSIL